MITRNEIEFRGRLGAKVEDKDKFLFSRVQNNYWVAIYKDDNGLYPHILDGFWESWIMTWVENNVPNGSTVADLGANVGFYTFQLGAKKCIVDAFEPNPKIYWLLEQGLQKNSTELNLNINLFQQAVSNTKTKLDFIIPRNHPMNGSLHHTVYAPNGEDIISVDAVNELKPYDFIKIDIEGAEIDVFEILDPIKHPLVLMEFRWDRYKEPIKFAQALFDKYNAISFVKHDGIEEQIDRPSLLEAREHEDWMLVLR